jgi:hypothetical protein
MKPWPHRIRGVSDHALVRYLGRIEGWDIVHVAEWLKDEGHPVTDPMILWAMAQAGLDVDAARARVFAEVDDRKRDAIPSEITPGHFMVTAASGVRYIVTADGRVVTTLRSRWWLKEKWRSTVVVEYGPDMATLKPVPA